jgi:hypothetical protein
MGLLYLHLRLFLLQAAVLVAHDGIQLLGASCVCWSFGIFLSRRLFLLPVMSVCGHDM